MDFKGKQHKQHEKNAGKVKAFEEISEEIATNEKLKQRQPTPQPKDFDAIDY